MSQTISGIEVALTPLSPSKQIYGEIPAPQPGTTTLPAGHLKSPGSRALPTSIIFDRDVEIPLRDGVRLRADVFRPNSDTKVPALVVWGPYGKTGSSPLNLHVMPGRAGVEQSRLSGYESFEGPDPAEWVARGYAIVNVDSRGTVNSEGDIRVQGSAEGRDGCDAVEFIAALPWCNSSVGMAGNSWLAMVQYHIAAQDPPHLKCVAPLEGLSDLLREQVCRGGIPDPGFFRAIAHNLRGGLYFPVM
jgi:putative CocE/NonD family hydrolase